MRVEKWLLSFAKKATIRVIHGRFFWMHRNLAGSWCSSSTGCLCLSHSLLSLLALFVCQRTGFRHLFYFLFSFHAFSYPRLTVQSRFSRNWDRRGEGLSKINSKEVTKVHRNSVDKHCRICKYVWK